MLQLDYKSGVPIYDQLISGIIRLKMLGALRAGDPLPSVRQMAAKLGINPNTVQRAYASLEEKGVIYSVAGKGSFISEGTAPDNEALKLGIKNVEKAILEAQKMGVEREQLQELINDIYGEAIK